MSIRSFAGRLHVHSAHGTDASRRIHRATPGSRGIHGLVSDLDRGQLFMPIRIDPIVEEDARRSVARRIVRSLACSLDRA